jgi:hypothetical protein
MNKHLRSLAFLFFFFAYLTAVAMAFEDSLFLKFGGVALGLFLTHQLVDQFANK